MIQLQRSFSLVAVAALVIGLAVCSKISFLLLIILSHEGTKTLLPEQKPVALLCIGCSLIAPSVLVLLKNIWKVCYKTSKLPRKRTTALVLLFELVASVGAAGLTIALMPHLDVVINVTILNGVSVLSALLHVIARCSTRKNKDFLMSSIITFIILFVGYSLFLALYIIRDSPDVKTTVWAGFAVGGSILVFFNWWENYFRWICEKSRSVFLKDFLKDLTRCNHKLHILCSLLRIVVIGFVLSFYVPLAKMDWSIVTSTPGSEKMTILTIFLVQLISSVLCHWFASTACKIQAVRRCFILLLYLASLAAMTLLIVPVVIHYQNYRSSMNTTESFNFKSYCDALENEGNLFLQLVVDATQTLCFLDVSEISSLTGAAASMWIGFGLASLHIWFSNVFCIRWTQDLFTKHVSDGVFIEPSSLSTQIHIQNKDRTNQKNATAMVYLCATMWHETQDEMKNTMNSIFSLDQHRPKKQPTFEDFTFEAHIYFDDAFEHADGIQEHRLNKYAKDLVNIITDVYGTFKNIDETFLRKQQQIPDYQVMKTPYGGCLVVTMPHGNNVFIHFKDKELVRLKKRWSQVMYIRYLLDWKFMTKNGRKWQEENIERKHPAATEKTKRNTFLLTLDGDTDFQPDAVQLLVDHLKIHRRVGAVCGRIHPTGSGPAVWFQRFEYAICHWLQKTTEHVFGYVLCSPGCFSLFRAEALTGDNVIKKYSTKSTEASHYIQYDHGEDRWLSTLLLKQGWRMHYIAASNAYTSAPQNFKELFNQRRRWLPTTLVNMNDLLGFTNDDSKMKTSKLYIIYQRFNLITAILTPATICFLVAGSLSFTFNIRSAAALVLAVIPPSVYLGLCFKLREETQMTAAAVLSIMYAFLLLVGIITVIGSMLIEQTILTLSAIFFITLSVIYTTAAILHPIDFPLLFCAWIYIVFLPSASILLVIYSLVNMNCVSWGTRERKPASGTADSADITNQTTSYKCWKTELQNLSSEVHLQEDSLSEEEETFWKELQDEYLQPLQYDKKTQEKMENDLRELRNKTTLRFFSVNALWLLLTFILQVFEVSIQINIVNLNFEGTGDEIQMEPIGFMFFLGFVLSLLFQFIGMLYYRVQSFTDFMASLDAELEQNGKIKRS